MPIQNGYHSRGYLPHIKVDGGTYFVTFRLADSLPRQIVLRLKEQRRDLAARASDAKRSAKPALAWYTEQVDSLLDRNLGSSALHEPGIAQLVMNALRHFDAQRYLLSAWCVMPNHVHAVVRPLGRHSLDAILHSWKSYTAHQARKLLGTTGAFWQRESHDHWIRDDADLAHCVWYTEENPVKARLCIHASDWPWSSAHPGATGTSSR